MPHISGDKISARHSTATESAAPVVTHLQGDPRVTKIMLGYINNNAATGGNPRVKIIDERAGLALSISGGGANQTLRVYFETEGSRAGVKETLETFARGEGYQTSSLDRR